MKTYHCAQRGEEWHTLRANCLITASDAGAFLTKNDQRSKDAREKRILKYLSRDCYIFGDSRLIEIREKESKSLDFNLAVQRGNEFEAEAIDALSRIVGMPIDTVGLITTDDGLFGASPDGLIGSDAGVECKVPLPESHLSYLLEHLDTGEMIADYLHQVHFNLAISERKVWHFYSHSVERSLGAPEWIEHPPLHIPVHRNAITDQMVKGMDLMRQEFSEIRGKIRNLRNK